MVSSVDHGKRHKGQKKLSADLTRRLRPDSRAYRSEARNAPLIITADYRVLVVFSLFNSIFGYDEEDVAQMTNERITMRRYCAQRIREVDLGTVESWRSFHRNHPDHIWAYLYFALTRSSSNFLSPAVLREQIPPDIKGIEDELSGFEYVMVEFADLVQIQELYDALLPSWEAAVREYDQDKISRVYPEFMSF